MIRRQWLVAYNSPVYIICRGYRHHALLHLVRLHYIKKEYPAARRVSFEYPFSYSTLSMQQLLAEAIDTARTSGDKVILHHCLRYIIYLSVSFAMLIYNSILHRLPTESGQRPNLQEIQTDLHPLEILYDTYKLLDEEHVGSPLLFN